MGDIQSNLISAAMSLKAKMRLFQNYHERKLRDSKSP